MSELTLDFVRDKANFPMVWVGEIDAYIHWLPVTKVQFETFMCAAPDTRFDEGWYESALELNGRTTPGAVRQNNYWQAILTGIYPSEAQKYAAWCGDNYDIPTQDEWFAAYNALKQVNEIKIDFADHMPHLSDRARLLIKRMDAASKRVASTLMIPDRRVTHQMLMRYGVMEWVNNPNARHGQEWVGAGEPNREFHNLAIAVERGQTNQPMNPTSTRMKHYGFRLIRRPE
jgi:hypothetical protein